MVMQAEWWGYEVRPWARWQKENIIVAEFEPVGCDLLDAIRKIAVELGTKYDYRSAFWLGVTSWVRRWLKSRLSLRVSRTPHQLMCSEAVVRLLNYGEYKVVQGVDPELVSPEDLLKLVRSSDEFVWGRR
jgi:hypothetical protein